jgi:hypothetical protein
MMNNLSASETREEYAGSIQVPTSEGAAPIGSAEVEHYWPSNMDLDPDWDDPIKGTLPKHIKNAQPVAYTIQDGEDLGFGSDTSEFEEAPSDYSEEFCSWEVFGCADDDDSSSDSSQSYRNTRQDWEPFRSQEVLLCFRCK